ncbi:MAG: hypothetical protein AAF226_18915 [Verrucomicrobiota bacterium]
MAWHTGRVVVEIPGQNFEFSGENWRGPDEELVARLQFETGFMSHADCLELAKLALKDAGVPEYDIISVEFDGVEPIEPGEVS